MPGRVGVRTSRQHEGMSGDLGTDPGPSDASVSSKVEGWKRYFRDRGLSAGDIPKALIVHEVGLRVEDNVLMHCRAAAVLIVAALLGVAIL